MRLTRYLVAFFCLCVHAASPAADTIIRNGRIIDGTGADWFHGDIAISGGRIVGIGDLQGVTASQEIDAKNNIVAPGFIDVHTHADEDVFKMPLCENFIRDGVTTIITGNCGGSTLEVGEYLSRIKSDGVALNVATLVGHNSVLTKVKGSKAGELTPEQREHAHQIIATAMEEGAVGFSTGLIYTPGTYSNTQEIIDMNKVAGKYGGIYATHMRDEASAVLTAIDEAVRIAEEGNTRLEISHFKLPRDVAKKIGGADAMFAKVRQARERGLEVWVDQYPYTASSTTLSVMLPDWVREDGDEAGRKLFDDPAKREKVLADMRQNNEVKRGRKDLSYAVIASCKAHPDYAGFNVKEVAQIIKLRAGKGDSVDFKAIPRDQWPDVSMTDQYNAVIDIYRKGSASCVYHTMDEKEVDDIMRSPLVSVCSDSGVRSFGSGVPHPRGYGSNARILGRYVRERSVLPLPEAIRKMTSMPATAFRIMDRGLLREGYWADIVIFDPATVTDKSTFESPHHYSEGFAYVLVNGGVVVDHDTTTGSKPGAPIYGPGYKAPQPAQ
ncbi:D-aminoacylase [Candidatus Sumerlaeota bacterium]|nr:D-aminoacylase [Candidatus Sumerlaeota bacterium]